MSGSNGEQSIIEINFLAVLVAAMSAGISLPFSMRRVDRRFVIAPGGPLRFERPASGGIMMRNFSGEAYLVVISDDQSLVNVGPGATTTLSTDVMVEI